MNQSYIRIRTALLHELARRGLKDWTDKLPPEFVLAAIEALKGLLKEAAEPQETEDEHKA